MVTGTLAFLAGLLAFQFVAALPPPWWLAVLLPLAAGGWLLPRGWRAVPALAIGGFLWAWLHAAVLLGESLPLALERQDLLLQGVIASLPEDDGQRSRFLFKLDQPAQAPPAGIPRVLRLSWFHPQQTLRAGQRWQLQVRLKQARGQVNPGVFDYEGWLFQQGIRATGYVTGRKRARLLNEDSGRYPLQRLRQQLAGELHARVGSHPLGGVAAALALGVRQDISQQQWQIFRHTGTNHLVAISGLHIGLVAGLTFFLWRRLWPWPGRVPAPKAAALAALAAAAGYAALAGFSIPTRRALIMIGVIMLAVLLQRNTRPARILALAALAIVLPDPLAVLSPGFWLSFGAVAIILYGMGNRLAVTGWWWRWGRVQALVAVGLAPLLAVWFQQIPLIGVLANLLAVPWISLFSVPLVLAGVLSMMIWPAAADIVLMLAMRSLDLAWWWLQWCAGLLPADWGLIAAQGWTLLPALAGVAWLLAPRGWPARWLGALWCIPLLFWRVPGPAPGEVELTVLDVGQGLAVLVRTAGHVLVYDTGPPYGSSTDAGERVVVPVLRHLGHSRVDALVVSHAHSDHDGGVDSLLAAMPVARVLRGSDDGRVPEGSTLCRRGQRWAWDRVDFRILHPGAAGRQIGKNNNSCVLQIDSVYGTVLLTGDIEEAAEAELLQQADGRLSASVLQAPHHGSSTSSTPAFVRAVGARHVIFSTGYGNRWQFPHAEVVQRYQTQGSGLYNTALQGAITVYLGAAGVRVAPYREAAARYWFNQHE